MGFLQRLFGGEASAPADREERDTARRFRTLRDDGVRARNMGELPYAVRCFTEALAICDDLETRSYLAEVHLRMQDYDKALPLLHQLAQAEPDNVEIALLKAQAEGRTGQHEAMRATCDAILAARPDEHRALYLAAEAAHGLSDDFTAIALLTRAVQAEPGYAAARLLRARILAGMGQYAEVTEDVEALRADGADSEEILLLHAEALAATGHTEEALVAYDAVRRANPFSHEAVARLGALYEQTGRRAEALQLYDEAIELMPDFAEAYRLRGGVRLALNDKAGAADDLKRSLELNPEAAAALEGEFTNVENRMAERYRNMNPYGF